MGELEKVRNNIDERYNAEMRDCIARFNSTLEQDENGRYILSQSRAYDLLSTKIECAKIISQFKLNDVKGILSFDNYAFRDEIIFQYFGHAYMENYEIDIPQEIEGSYFYFTNCAFNKVTDTGLCKNLSDAKRQVFFGIALLKKSLFLAIG